VPACGGDQLHFLPGGSELLRFSNDGGTCGLAGHPRLEGRDAATGTWTPIPSYPLPGDPGIGFPWTGRFAPTDAAAVVALHHYDRAQYPAGCPYGTTTVRTFDALRVVLSAGGGAVDVPDFALTVGPCTIGVSEFGYDSSDR
jgi:hypothetical protein